ncbi:MAG: hypothetical protein P8Y00_08100 [Deltaproteobacteria bacterium]|jgi:hypothetical protein
MLEGIGTEEQADLPGRIFPAFLFLYHCDIVAITVEIFLRSILDKERQVKAESGGIDRALQNYLKETRP